LGEVTADSLTSPNQQGVLSTIEEQVRFSRRRFGHYDLIDFVAVRLRYASSGVGSRGEAITWSSRWMAPDKPPALALCPRQLICRRPTAD
jgi:hypothetical protein